MDILWCDLRQRAVPVIGVVAGVAEPARRVLQAVAQILGGQLRRRRLLRVEGAGDNPAGDERGKGEIDPIAPVGLLRRPTRRTLPSSPFNLRCSVPPFVIPFAP